jgi:hypothetical protein
MLRLEADDLVKQLPPFVNIIVRGDQARLLVTGGIVEQVVLSEIESLEDGRDGATCVTVKENTTVASCVDG